MRGRPRLTTEIFIERAKQLHGDKYDYSKVEYKGAVDKVLIHCNECGAEFWQTPTQHLRTIYSCPKCINKKKRQAKRARLEKLQGDILALTAQLEMI